MIAATVLSACGPKATPAPAASTEVEVFSWWVGPGEADGLAAMVKVFNAQYPGINFVNAAVAGTIFVAFVSAGVAGQCRCRVGKCRGTIATDQRARKLASMAGESGGDSITGGTIGRIGRTAEYPATFGPDALVMETAAIDAAAWKDRDDRCYELGNE